MTEEEFIGQARVDWPDMTIWTMLDACEANYLNGTYDDVSGDVESALGHFYLIERWIVVTDTIGVKWLHTYADVEEAEKAFEQFDEAYAEWDNE
jgi:hypothetical protein